jgi:hypothetical protein
MKKTILTLMAAIALLTAIPQYSSAYCEITDKIEMADGSMTLNFAANEVFMLYRSMDGIVWEEVTHPLTERVQSYTDPYAFIGHLGQWSFYKVEPKRLSKPYRQLKE